MIMLTATTRKALQQLLKMISAATAEARKKAKITIDIDPIEIK